MLSCVESVFGILYMRLSNFWLAVNNSLEGEERFSLLFLICLCEWVLTLLLLVLSTFIADEVGLMKLLVWYVVLMLMLRVWGICGLIEVDLGVEGESALLRNGEVRRGGVGEDLSKSR